MRQNITIGIMAHVDAGKTTLCEQILYQSGALRSAGRVDHGDTALDTDTIEKARGITVFTGQAGFTHHQHAYTLIDTPGHVDFACEAERAMQAMDLCVLLLDGSAAVPGHAASLFRLAEKRHIPTLIFVNKTDLVSFDRAKTLNAVQRRFGAGCTALDADGVPDFEALADIDENFMEAYLGDAADASMAKAAMARVFWSGHCHPVLFGAALQGEGVKQLLDTVDSLCDSAPFPDFEKLQTLPFAANVYQVRREKNGERLTYLRIRSGRLHPRDEFALAEQREKVNQIRVSRGNDWQSAEYALPGDAVAVTGLSLPVCGGQISGSQIIPPESTPQYQPVLRAKAVPPDGTSAAEVLRCMRLLEDEDPMLQVDWVTETQELHVRLMGTVQREVLTQLLEERFGMKVSFENPSVLYRETVAKAAVGCGHYEPLRHYAECHLLLKPGTPDSGITFDSRCHVDDLPAPYQSLIHTHVMERVHPGVLIGAPLTDTQVILLSGKAHLKHTEGGDFREAVYRAIRQGLHKAECTLLEPYYRFEISAPADCGGKLMTMLSRLNAECEVPESDESRVLLRGRGPVSTLADQPPQVRALTHGAGDMLLETDGYDRCHNPQEVIDAAGYRADADNKNPAGSVFCAHGAGYFVPWEESDSLMHLPVETPQADE